MRSENGDGASSLGRLGVMRLDPDPASVREARLLVASVAEAAGAAPGRVDELLVAVSEACTNAIESHLGAHEPGAVEIEVVREASALVVTVEDHGRGFDLGARLVRPPFGHPEHLGIERGWGIDLMGALVDRLSFEPTASGMRVRLVIDVPPR